MKTLKFKTNINCENCVRSVTPFLDKIDGISWKVDTDHTDKILTVESRDAIPEEIIEKVKKAGFEIEMI